MIEMNVHGGNDKIMGIVLEIGQAFGQVSLMVIVNIRQRGDAINGLVLSQTLGFYFLSQQIANGFGSIGISPLLYPLIELRG